VEISDPVKTVSDRLPNGRLEGGLFAKGNRLAKGNKNARRMSELRQTLLGAVDEVKLVQAFQKLQDLALAGDLAAMNLYLGYAIGKPTQAVEVTGAEGSPLGGGELSSIVMAALDRYPDARFAVAAELRHIRDTSSEEL
jgi:hypothetical protein